MDFWLLKGFWCSSAGSVLTLGFRGGGGGGVGRPGFRGGSSGGGGETWVQGWWWGVTMLVGLWFLVQLEVRVFSSMCALAA